MARTKSQRQGGSPHDGLFHLAFSVPGNAASELRHILPAELVQRIQWDKLRKASDKFVDAKLTNRYSDILFEVEIDEEPAFINVLFEHKSEPDRWTLLQLLEYMVRIWRAYLRANASKKIDRLPLILPVVLHHGESGWTAPRRFIEYFGALNDVMRPYVPDFGFLLDDIAKVSPDKLVGRPLPPEVKLVLLCLMLGRTPQRFFEELEQRPTLLKGTWSGADGALVIEGLVVYMEKVGGVPQEETITAMQQILKLSPAEEVIFAHEIRARRAEERGMREGMLKGMREGKLEGMREGKLEGMREGEVKEALGLVSKLLTQRFGALSTEVTTRLQAATKEELEEMGLRILTATTLDEVLGKPKRKRR